MKTRRQFLKSIGKVIAGCVVVPSVVKAKSELTGDILDAVTHKDAGPLKPVQHFHYCAQDEYWERLQQKVIKMYRPKALR